MQYHETIALAEHHRADLLADAAAIRRRHHRPHARWWRRSRTRV